MIPTTNHIPGLMSLISSAVAPVVLISAVAIFFSALTAKHSHLSDQLRQITAEFRRTPNDNPRRICLGKQLHVFERRMGALWMSTGFLSFSLLFFVATVFFVIATQHTQKMGIFGIGTLIGGLVCMVAAILFELVEVSLARASLRLEVLDVDTEYKAACAMPAPPL